MVKKTRMLLLFENKKGKKSCKFFEKGCNQFFRKWKYPILSLKMSSQNLEEPQSLQKGKVTFDVRRKRKNIFKL